MNITAIPRVLECGTPDVYIDNVARTKHVTVGRSGIYYIIFWPSVFKYIGLQKRGL